MHIAETGKNISRAAALILQGKLVAVPTETVYGLAANALDEKAVLSIFEAKQRPFFDPLIVHVSSVNAVEEFAFWSDERLRSLAQKFWPGPLTLLLPKKERIPAIVTSGLDQVALRVPAHPLTLALLESVKVPLAAPSANPFGYVSPTEAGHVNKQLGSKVAYILDGGPCEVGIESTIVGVEEERLCVYRLGGLPLEEIERVAGKAELFLNVSSNPQSPGQLKSHYAPRKPLYLGDMKELAEKYKGQKIAVIGFGAIQPEGDLLVFNLSPSGSLKEAAINLFRYLREADESDAALVIAQEVPQHGLGRAINDRLRRAAG